MDGAGGLIAGRHWVCDYKSVSQLKNSALELSLGQAAA